MSHAGSLGALAECALLQSYSADSPAERAATLARFKRANPIAGRALEEQERRLHPPDAAAAVPRPPTLGEEAVQAHLQRIEGQARENPLRLTSAQKLLASNPLRASSAGVHASPSRQHAASTKKHARPLNFQVDPDIVRGDDRRFQTQLYSLLWGECTETDTEGVHPVVSSSKQAQDLFAELNVADVLLYGREAAHANDTDQHNSTTQHTTARSSPSTARTAHSARVRRASPSHSTTTEEPPVAPMQWLYMQKSSLTNEKKLCRKIEFDHRHVVPEFENRDVETPILGLTGGNSLSVSAAAAASAAAPASKAGIGKSCEIICERFRLDPSVEDEEAAAAAVAAVVAARHGDTLEGLSSSPASSSPSGTRRMSVFGGADSGSRRPSISMTMTDGGAAMRPLRSPSRKASFSSPGRPPLRPPTGHRGSILLAAPPIIEEEKEGAVGRMLPLLPEHRRRDSDDSDSEDGEAPVISRRPRGSISVGSGAAAAALLTQPAAPVVSALEHFQHRMAVHGRTDPTQTRIDKSCFAKEDLRSFLRNPYGRGALLKFVISKSPNCELIRCTWVDKGPLDAESRRRAAAARDPHSPPSPFASRQIKFLVQTRVNSFRLSDSGFSYYERTSTYPHPQDHRIDEFDLECEFGLEGIIGHAERQAAFLKQRQVDRAEAEEKRQRQAAATAATSASGSESGSSPRDSPLLPADTVPRQPDDTASLMAQKNHQHYTIRNYEAGSRLHTRLRAICDKLAAYFDLVLASGASSTSGSNRPSARRCTKHMQLYFRRDATDQMWLLWSDCLEFEESHEQSTPAASMPPSPRRANVRPDTTTVNAVVEAISEEHEDEESRTHARTSSTLSAINPVMSDHDSGSDRAPDESDANSSDSDSSFDGPASWRAPRQPRVKARSPRATQSLAGEAPKALGEDSPRDTESTLDQPSTPPAPKKILCSHCRLATSKYDVYFLQLHSLLHTYRLESRTNGYFHHTKTEWSSLEWQEAPVSLAEHKETERRESLSRSRRGSVLLQGDLSPPSLSRASSSLTPLQLAARRATPGSVNTSPLRLPIAMPMDSSQFSPPLLSVASPEPMSPLTLKPTIDVPSHSPSPSPLSPPLSSSPPPPVLEEPPAFALLLDPSLTAASWATRQHDRSLLDQELPLCGKCVGHVWMDPLLVREKFGQSLNPIQHTAANMRSLGAPDGTGSGATVAPPFAWLKKKHMSPYDLAHTEDDATDPNDAAAVEERRARVSSFIARNAAAAAATAARSASQATMETPPRVRKPDSMERIYGVTTTPNSAVASTRASRKASASNSRAHTTRTGRNSAPHSAAPSPTHTMPYAQSQSDAGKRADRRAQEQRDVQLSLGEGDLAEASPPPQPQRKHILNKSPSKAVASAVAPEARDIDNTFLTGVDDVTDLEATRLDTDAAEIPTAEAEEFVVPSLSYVTPFAMPVLPPGQERDASKKAARTADRAAREQRDLAATRPATTASRRGGPRRSTAPLEPPTVMQGHETSPLNVMVRDRPLSSPTRRPPNASPIIIDRDLRAQSWTRALAVLGARREDQRDHGEKKLEFRIPNEPLKSSASALFTPLQADTVGDRIKRAEAYRANRRSASATRARVPPPPEPAQPPGEWQEARVKRHHLNRSRSSLLDPLEPRAAPGALAAASAYAVGGMPTIDHFTPARMHASGTQAEFRTLDGDARPETPAERNARLAQGKMLDVSVSPSKRPNARSPTKKLPRVSSAPRIPFPDMLPSRTITARPNLSPASRARLVRLHRMYRVPGDSFLAAADSVREDARARLVPDTHLSTLHIVRLPEESTEPGVPMTTAEILAAATGRSPSPGPRSRRSPQTASPMRTARLAFDTDETEQEAEPPLPDDESESIAPAAAGATIHSDVEPEQQPESEPEPEPKPKPESGSEPKSEPNLEPESETRNEVKTEPENDPEPKPQPALEPEPEAQPEAEPEPVSEPESQPEPSSPLEPALSSPSDPPPLDQSPNSDPDEPAPLPPSKSTAVSPRPSSSPSSPRATRVDADDAEVLLDQSILLAADEGDEIGWLNTAANLGDSSGPTTASTARLQRTVIMAEEEDEDAGPTELLVLGASPLPATETAAAPAEEESTPAALQAE